MGNRAFLEEFVKMPSDEYMKNAKEKLETVTRGDVDLFFGSLTFDGLTPR